MRLQEILVDDTHNKLSIFSEVNVLGANKYLDISIGDRSNVLHFANNGAVYALDVLRRLIAGNPSYQALITEAFYIEIACIAGIKGQNPYSYQEEDVVDTTMYHEVALSNPKAVGIPFGTYSEVVNIFKPLDYREDGSYNLRGAIHSVGSVIITTKVVIKAKTEFQVYLLNKGMKQSHIDILMNVFYIHSGVELTVEEQIAQRRQNGYSGTGVVIGRDILEFMSMLEVVYAVNTSSIDYMYKYYHEEAEEWVTTYRSSTTLSPMWIQQGEAPSMVDLLFLNEEEDNLFNKEYFFSFFRGVNDLIKRNIVPDNRHIQNKSNVTYNVPVYVSSLKEGSDGVSIIWCADDEVKNFLLSNEPGADIESRNWTAKMFSRNLRDNVIGKNMSITCTNKLEVLNAMGEHTKDHHFVSFMYQAKANHKAYLNNETSYEWKGVTNITTPYIVFTNYNTVKDIYGKKSNAEDIVESFDFLLCKLSNKIKCTVGASTFGSNVFMNTEVHRHCVQGDTNHNGDIGAVGLQISGAVSQLFEAIGHDVTYFDNNGLEFIMRSLLKGKVDILSIEYKFMTDLLYLKGKLSLDKEGSVKNNWFNKNAVLRAYVLGGYLSNVTWRYPRTDFFYVSQFVYKNDIGSPFLLPYRLIIAMAGDLDGDIYNLKFMTLHNTIKVFGGKENLFGSGLFGLKSNIEEFGVEPRTNVHFESLMFGADKELGGYNDEY